MSFLGVIFGLVFLLLFGDIIGCHFWVSFLGVTFVLVLLCYFLVLFFCLIVFCASVLCYHPGLYIVYSYSLTAHPVP